MGLEKPKNGDRPEDEVLIERETEEYTFKPDLSLTSSSYNSMLKLKDSIERIQSPLNKKSRPRDIMSRAPRMKVKA